MKIDMRNRPFKPLVYVCAPYSGDVAANVETAKRFAEYAYNTGNIPLTPHLLFPFMDDENETHREDAIVMDVVLMGKCNEVWVLDGHISDGMAFEIEKARRRRQTIRHFAFDYWSKTFHETNVTETEK